MAYSESTGATIDPGDYGLGNQSDSPLSFDDVISGGVFGEGLPADGWGFDSGLGAVGSYSGTPASYDSGSFLSMPDSDESFLNTSLGRFLRGLGLNQVSKNIPGAGMALNFASAKTPNQMSRAMGGTTGSVLGGMAFGPMGALAGGYLGGKLGGMFEGNGQAYNGKTSSAGEAAGGFNLGDVAGGLGQIYSAYQANQSLKGAGSINSAVQDQIAKLSDMYGQNSPYAAALRQNLERKDAAAGRNSQYGPREAQLQALLADKATQAASAIGNLANTGQANSLAMADRRNQQRAQTISMLTNMGQKSGLFNKLGSMFDSSSGAAAPALSYDYPDQQGMPF